MSTTSARRTSTVPTSTRDSIYRPKDKDAAKKDIWSGMLDGVSSGKKLPEKTAFVLGGTPQTQQDFLASLNTDNPKRRNPNDRNVPRRPPIANAFALGYTYQNVMDAEQEDTLARLSLYLLHTPSTPFTSLLKPLLTPQSIPNSCAVVLLDWAEPWLWLRQLRAWVRALREVVRQLDDEAKDALEENMKALRHGRHRSSSNVAQSGSNEPDDSLSLPTGPGEWDSPLGLPLIVVAQNADKIENLEKENGWKDEEFDFIMQYLRTVLLKHGAALMYAMPSTSQQSNIQLQALVHSCLGITNLLGQDRGGTRGGAVKHNVVDRDRVLVPMGWDSWGKIRILREGFEVESVSKQWDEDLEDGSRPQTDQDSEANGEADPEDTRQDKADAVTLYEDIIRSPNADNVLMSSKINGANSIEVQTGDHQEFLTQQQKILEQLRIEDEREKANRDAKRTASSGAEGTRSAAGATQAGSGVVEEHIGPVQFNMGGIQVDAEDVVRRLKDRNTTPGPETPGRERDEPQPAAAAAAAAASSPGASTPLGEKGIPDGMDSAMLMNFFQGLTKRKAGGSTASTPQRQ